MINYGFRMHKGQMSLEYVVKMIILIVVLSVVVGMIYNFSNKAKEDFKNVNGVEEEENNVRAEIIEGNFDERAMANYIEMCWAETRTADEDKVCFIIDGVLVPNIAGDPNTNIIAEVDDSIWPYLNLDGADFNNDKMFTIAYEFIGNRLVVKS